MESTFCSFRVSSWAGFLAKLYLGLSVSFGVFWIAFGRGCEVLAKSMQNGENANSYYLAIFLLLAPALTELIFAFIEVTLQGMFLFIATETKNAKMLKILGWLTLAGVAVGLVMDFCALIKDDQPIAAIEDFILYTVPNAVRLFTAYITLEYYRDIIATKKSQESKSLLESPKKKRHNIHKVYDMAT